MVTTVYNPACAGFLCDHACEGLSATYGRLLVSLWLHLGSSYCYAGYGCISQRLLPRVIGEGTEGTSVLRL